MNLAAEPVSPPATMPRQRSKPLLPVPAVKSLLDKGEDEVKAMAEEGKLAWCWDVSLDPKHGRRELRILPACVADYLRGQACALEWAEVIRMLLPHDQPVILSKDITRILNVGSTHTYNLARRKLIAPCSTWGTGPKGCARFKSKSFTEFLQSRRFP